MFRWTGWRVVVLALVLQLLVVLPAGASPQVVATIGVGFMPNSVAVNPATNRTYVTNYAGLVVINGATKATIASISLTYAGLVAVNPTKNRVYVTTGSALTVIDGATNAVTA